jgi:hypothetical protein
MSPAIDLVSCVSSLLINAGADAWAVDLGLIHHESDRLGGLQHTHPLADPRQFDICRSGDGAAAAEWRSEN